MSVTWDAYEVEIQQAKQVDSRPVNSSHFRPGKQAEVFMWKPVYRDPGWKKRDLSISKPTRSLNIWTHRKFYKVFSDKV